MTIYIYSDIRYMRWLVSSFGASSANEDLSISYGDEDLYLLPFIGGAEGDVTVLTFLLSVCISANEGGGLLSILLPEGFGLVLSVLGSCSSKANRGPLLVRRIVFSGATLVLQHSFESEMQGQRSM